MRPDEHFQESSASREIVVADTSPLNYLVQISCDFLLPALYRRVIVPPSVISELSHGGAPQQVANWVSSLPDWIEVMSLKTTPDASLSLLDPGERDAIQLAVELRASTILIDERRGRQEAQSRGFFIVGTVGVLMAGQKADLVDAQGAFDRLTSQTSFRSTATLREGFSSHLGL